MRGTQTAITLSILTTLLAAPSAQAEGQLQNARDVTEGAQLPRPGAILVYDFEIRAQDVRVDSPGLDGVAAPAVDAADRQRAARRVAEELSEALVSVFRKRGAPARRASESDPVPDHALLLQGRFVAVDEGDRARRTVVGIGYGEASVKIRFQAYQQSPIGPRLLWEADVVSSTSKRPGLAAPAAVAGATGRMVGLVVGGARATTQGDVLESEARETAETIADGLWDRFRRQGWLRDAPGAD